MPSDLQRAASYWDSVAPASHLARWWQWPRIIAFQNERVCGEALPGWGAGLIAELHKRAPGRIFERGVSVACGNGSKEMALLRAGLVKHFDFFEISETRIGQGWDLYAAAGFADRVSWYVSDGIAHLELGPAYDMVYWDNALHHMPDTRRAVDASLTGLREGGAFVMNDFVGANRFQWTERELSYASAVRSGLAERHLRNPQHPQSQLPRKLGRPDIAKMIEIDPSEAADSENILPSIRAVMPNPAIWLLGGSIYHLALNDVLANVDPERDAATLESLLILEAALIELGETHYAAALAFKR
jgi:SAM-dependent methyltransferase